jgi:hypothetical protein
MVQLAGGFAARGHRVDLVLARAEGAFLADVPDEVNLIDLGVKGRSIAGAIWLAAVPVLAHGIDALRDRGAGPGWLRVWAATGIEPVAVGVSKWSIASSVGVREIVRDGVPLRRVLYRTAGRYLGPHSPRETDPPPFDCGTGAQPDL